MPWCKGRRWDWVEQGETLLDVAMHDVHAVEVGDGGHELVKQVLACGRQSGPSTELQAARSYRQHSAPSNMYTQKWALREHVNDSAQGARGTTLTQSAEIETCARNRK